MDSGQGHDDIITSFPAGQLSDLCSFGLSVESHRWFFRYTGTGFATIDSTQDDTLGSCDASFIYPPNPPTAVIATPGNHK